MSGEQQSRLETRPGPWVYKAVDGQIFDTFGGKLIEDRGYLDVMIKGYKGLWLTSKFLVWMTV